MYLCCCQHTMVHCLLVAVCCVMMLTAWDIDRGCTNIYRKQCEIQRKNKRVKENRVAINSAYKSFTRQVNYYTGNCTFVSCLHNTLYQLQIIFNALPGNTCSLATDAAWWVLHIQHNDEASELYLWTYSHVQAASHKKFNNVAPLINYGDVTMFTESHSHNHTLIVKTYGRIFTTKQPIVAVVPTLSPLHGTGCGDVLTCDMPRIWKSTHTWLVYEY